MRSTYFAIDPVVKVKIEKEIEGMREEISILSELEKVNNFKSKKMYQSKTNLTMQRKLHLLRRIKTKNTSQGTKIAHV